MSPGRFVAIGIIAFVAVAVTLTTVILTVMSLNDRSGEGRGCRDNSMCGGMDVCSISEDGVGVCVPSRCRTAQDRHRCNGLCQYDNDNLRCSCDGVHYQAHESDTPFCGSCTVTPSEAYAAAGGNPKDDGISSFVFCRAGEGRMHWARNTGDQSQVMPIFNSADSTVAAPYCVSSLTSRNFVVNKCPENSYCSNGNCVSMSTVPAKQRLPRTSRIAVTAATVMLCVGLVVFVTWLVVQMKSNDAAVVDSDDGTSSLASRMSVRTADFQ